MQTKTYFASSVPAALEVARKELGPEAMLLNSKPAPAESRAFGRLEVTFAFEPRRAEEAPFRPEPRFEMAAEPRAGYQQMRPEVPLRTEGRGGDPFAAALRQARPAPVRAEAGELDELRRQVEALRVAVGGTVMGAAPAEAPVAAQAPAFSLRNPMQGLRGRDSDGGLTARLERNGISASLARELTEAVAGRAGDPTANVIDEICRRIPRSPFGDWRAGETRLLAFVGPPGRGKTTSLVKVAVKFGIGARVPVRIYQAGAHGVGCQEQMARYAAILGVPFFACESLESLNLSLAGDGWKGLVLLDTPGISPAATGDIQELGRFFARRPEIERHLVLRAEARSADMAYMVSRFSAMGSLRLLFTGTEETLTTGTMAETIMTTGLGSTFIGTGQDIPEDLEELDVVRLARSVCGDRGMSVAAG